VIQITFDMTHKENVKEFKESNAVPNRNSRFLSLKGLPGILVGIYALVGAFAVQQFVSNYQNLDSAISLLPISYMEYLLIGIVVLVMVISILSVFIYTFRKAKRSGEKLWDISSKRLLIRFSLPLFTGGAICVLLYQFGFIRLISSCMLIFYGLALLNTRKYTSRTISYVGIAHLIIGLVSTQFIDSGIYFWAIGFGCIHIIYGILTYRKYAK
jgi:hypothetical protein